MFIYKITIHPINQVYIGLDTKDSNKLYRWYDHLRTIKRCEPKTKLHMALKEYGPENASIDIIHNNVDTLFELICLEIFYISHYDSYRNGLNSSQGGDCWGHKDLHLLTEEELQFIKANLSSAFTDYNNNVKWANKTKEERLAMIREKMFLTPEAIAKRTETLKAWYAADPSRKQEKLDGLAKWRTDNPEKSKEICRRNGAKSAEVTNRPIKVEFPDGSVTIFNSQQEFKRQHNKDTQYLVKQTALGLDVKGYRAWKLDKDDLNEAT